METLSVPFFCHGIFGHPHEATDRKQATTAIKARPRGSIPDRCFRALMPTGYLLCTSRSAEPYCKGTTFRSHMDDDDILIAPGREAERELLQHGRLA